MDENTIASNISNAVPLITGIVFPIINSIKNKLCENALSKLPNWKKEIKIKNNTFYLYLLFAAMLINILQIFISVLIHSITHSIAFSLIFIIIGTLIQIIIINNQKTVKENKALKKILLWLIADLPSCLFAFEFSLIIFYKNVLWVECIITILFLILEILGLLIFDNSKDIYSHSYVDICQSSGKLLFNINIDAIYRRGKWLIIKSDTTTEETHILIDSIDRYVFKGPKKEIVIEPTLIHIKQCKNTP